MVFSSNLFLFWFLPPVLVGNFLLPARFRNLFLLVVSTFFYMWGSGPVVVPFLLGIAFNYYLGGFIAKAQGRRAKLLLAFTLATDLSLLFYYKYFNFFCDQLTAVLAVMGIDWRRSVTVALPIGVSFFIFQAMTYPIEIYRREQEPASSLIDVGAYLALFAHLIAGPVVRYSDISDDLRSRTVSVDDFFSGIRRFAAGLAKKVLIANHVGQVADRVFGAAPGTLTPAVAWLGTFAYGLQIYFDFSGYSDMAIGMAKFFGFRFPENFNHPYRATSITDFWRRWHVTLSRWFRDFLYVPLGGNRRGPARTYANLLVVFFLCGLWHGAAWTFVAWGLFHGALLVIERLLKTRYGFEPSGVLGNVVTCLLVFLAWVLFRAPDISSAVIHMKTLFGMTAPSPTAQYFPLASYLTRTFVFYATCGCALSWLPYERLGKSPFWDRPAGVVLAGLSSMALMFLSASVLSTTSFNPFIYFRF